MRQCSVCGLDLIHSTLATRTSVAGEVIEYLTCDGCGHDNIVTGYINPRPADPTPGYFIFNERTELFDEYDTEGVLIRANVIYSPWQMPRPHDHFWPLEKRKPKRAGNETWVDERGPKDDPDGRTEGLIGTC